LRLGSGLHREAATKWRSEREETPASGYHRVFVALPGLSGGLDDKRLQQSVRRDGCAK